MTVIKNLKTIEERTALMRLTALWALNEAGLGGLLHLFRSPLTGIFVGGGAVLLIAMIAYVAKKPAVAIPRALLLVLIIKAAVSPHSPLPAYLAVTFQGLIAALLFTVLPSFRLAALLLGALALVESAIQKLLVMTILFGMPLWDSLDAFIDSVLEKFGFLVVGGGASGSWWVIGAYLSVYLIAGLLIGRLAGRLPEKVEAASQRLTLPDLTSDSESVVKTTRHRPLWRRPIISWIAGGLILVLAIYLLLPESRALLAPLWLMLRVVGILALWYLLIGPVLMQLLRRFLERKASDYKAEVTAALDLLPVFRQLARAAWEETKNLSGWKRWQELAVRIITYAIIYTKDRSPDAS